MRNRTCVKATSVEVIHSPEAIRSLSSPLAELNKMSDCLSSTASEPESIRRDLPNNPQPRAASLSGIHSRRKKMVEERSNRARSALGWDHYDQRSISFHLPTTLSNTAELRENTEQHVSPDLSEGHAYTSGRILVVLNHDMV